MKGRTDVELVELYRASHNERAFAELMRRYQDKLMVVMRRRLKDADAAEDVVQKTFVQVFRYIDRYDPKRSNFERWVFNIALNAMRSEMKKLGRPDRPRATVDVNRNAEAVATLAKGCDADLLDAFVNEEWRQEVRRFVESLDPTLCQAFVTVHVRRNSYANASRLTGVPAATLKSRVRVVLGLIQEALPDLPSDLPFFLDAFENQQLSEVA